MKWFKRDPIPEHAKRIFKCALKAGEATRAFLKAHGEEMSDTAWFGVVMEFQNLYIQLTDRAVFGRVPDPKRKHIMDEFCLLCINTAVSAICSGWGVERIARIQQECVENYAKSAMDYGACKQLFPEKEQGTGGTMIWEFSRTVSGIVGHDPDIAYIVFFTSLVDFKGLSMKAFVADACAFYS